MKLFMTTTRKAFTLIEIIMVIVILGIVSSIGSSIIANIYEQYLLQRATHNASLKTELAAQQIANYLSYRIPNTTLAKNPANLTDYLLVTDATNDSDYTHTQLEWIGTDNDSFSASIPPGWNGFADIAASNMASIVSPGSNLVLSNQIMSNLSKDTAGTSQVTLTAGPKYPAIFFRDLRYSADAAGLPLKNYNVLTCMGVTGADRSCISAVSSAAATPETLTFQAPGATNLNKLLVEHYKLAWTSYSICPKTRSNGNYDLVLFYNYRPWQNERLNGTNCSSTNGEKSTIIKNVTVFKFAESGNTVRFKLCAQENVGDYNLTICKEKAIIL